MDSLSIVLYAYCITVCTSIEQGVYTGCFYFPVKNVTMAPIRNWQVGVRQLPIQEEDDFWVIYRTERDVRIGKTPYRIDYRRPDVPIDYMPRREYRKFHGMATTVAYYERHRQFVPDFNDIQNKEEIRLSVLKSVNLLMANRMKTYRYFPRMSTLPSVPTKGRWTVPKSKEQNVLGRRFIYRNITRLKRPLNVTLMLKSTPGLEDFILRPPIAKTIPHGFRILFSDDPKRRIQEIQINARRNKAFMGLGDKTPGEMILDAELMQKQNKTKWVVTYKNRSGLKNHDVIFYWYKYSLKVKNKTYDLYGYNHYFRILYEAIYRKGMHEFGILYVDSNVVEQF